jgi:hypothetical protein
MGCDAGFDMVPPPTKGFVDRYNWDKFMERIKHHYKNDALVERKPNCLLFKAGEHPMLPFEGFKIFRFSAKITGSTASTTGVESYIGSVTRMAKESFGARVHYWNEFYERYGQYDWGEVNDSWKSYDKVCNHSVIFYSS